MNGWFDHGRPSTVYRGRLNNGDTVAVNPPAGCFLMVTAIVGYGFCDVDGAPCLLQVDLATIPVVYAQFASAFPTQFEALIDLFQPQYINETEYLTAAVTGDDGAAWVHISGLVFPAFTL